MLSGGTIRTALAAVGAVGNQLVGFDQLAVGADTALRQTPPGLTVAGAASWLATQAQESAYFRTTKEYGTGQSYAPYIGRTFEQVTWKSNYLKFGAWCHDRGLVVNPDVFGDDPRSLSDYRWAWLGGVWYFEVNGLWKWANAGDHWRVSQAVNGGLGRVGTHFTPHGWTARLKMFEAFRMAGPTLLPNGSNGGGQDLPVLHEGDVSDLVWRLQVFLNHTFPLYSHIEAGDQPPSRLGPQTMAALTEFGKRADVPTPSPFAVDAATWAALRGFGFAG